MRVFTPYNKYRNKPTFVDGIRFASKREAERYGMLKLAEKSGAIKDLKLQPRFELQPKFEKNGIKFRAIEYIADFSYKEKGKVIIEDVKGYKEDKVFLLKHKLFEYKYPDFKIQII